MSEDGVGVVAMVEGMLGKRMGVVGKGELCRLVVVQYGAIENLVRELRRVDPGNVLLRGLVGVVDGDKPERGV